MDQNYLQRILTSRVYDVAVETPLDVAPRLSDRLGNDVRLKREDLQPIFSFKIRGAYNRMAALSEEERSRGVIAASAGNHAQGVAFAARRHGCRALIVMPVTTPTDRKFDFHSRSYSSRWNGHIEEARIRSTAMAVERILASWPFLTRLLPLRPQNRCRSRSSRASPPGRRASGRCVGEV